MGSDSAWASVGMRAAWLCAVACVAAMVSACGGGGGGGDEPPPPPPPGALTVLTASPESGSWVRTDVVFSVEFNVPLDPATATAANVRLSSDTGPVPADIRVTQQTLTVTPTTRLKLLTAYELQVTTGVKGANGEILAQSFQVAVNVPRAVFDVRTIVPEVDFQGGADPDPMMAVTDLDGDGRKDLATASRLESDAYASGYTLRLYRQASDGGFALTQRIDFSLGEQLYSVRYPGIFALDIDHDGVDELVLGEDQSREDAAKVAEWNLTGLRVFKRGSDGQYAFVAYVRTAYVQSIRVGDVDGDGHADLVGVRDFDADGRVYGFRDSGFQVMLSRPGGLQLRAPVVGLRQLIDTVHLRDLDRDGDLDLLFTQRPGVLVYAGDGTGAFSHDATRSAMMAPLCTNYCEMPVVADINGDGWPDFIARSRNEPMWLSQADGGYATQAPQALPGTGGGMAPAAGDFDQDGHEDLVWFFGDPLGAPSFMPLFGNGAAQFELPPADVLSGYNAASLHRDAKLIVDIDGDGFLDVLIAEHNSGVILLRQMPD
jgi:hypothetical protein